MTVHPGAMRAVFQALADAIRPQPPVSFPDWLPKNIILVDGPRKGEYWTPDDAPYLVEIAQCLSMEHPCNLVTVRKSQQTGVSILALAWMLYLAENAPDNALYGVPGIDMLQDINSGKLQPLIDAWQAETEKTVIFPDVSRSGKGSTIYEKRFAGGSIYLANANVVTDLSGKTTRYGVKDEVSKWSTLPNGADPENLFFGRFTAFRRQKSYKIFELSTPELDSGDLLGEGPGHCRIDSSFRKSDQRFWFITCPECGTWQVQTDDRLQVDAKHPHKSTMRCIKCTHHISEMERVPAVRSGHYRPTATGPDRHPGFHVDAFMSLMMSYEAIAEDKLKYSAKGEAGEKDYNNLICGLPHRMKGNAPDHQRLFERREDYPEGMIPAGGLILVAGADVQSYGIFCEVVAYGADRQSWNVMARFFPGDTLNPQTGAWADLSEFVETEFADTNGVLRRIDATAVDSGYRTNQVTEWCKRHANTYAIKGVPGRGKPAIGTPSKISVSKRGKRRKHGTKMIWPVGTWALKAELYGNLHKLGLSSGEACDPPGFCHFHKGLDQEFFLQLTAEYFDVKLVKGKLFEEWRSRRPDNHYLDCRVYAMAMAEHMGLSTNTPAQWAMLTARYGMSIEADLFSGEARKVSASQAPVGEPKAAEAPPSGNKPDNQEQHVNRWKKRR